MISLYKILDWKCWSRFSCSFAFETMLYITPSLQTYTEIHQDTKNKEEMELDHDSRSRSSTVPAIIAEQERRLTIEFCSENLPISASIPINLNEADTRLCDEGSNQLDTEVVDILNGAHQRLELTFDEDPVASISPTGEIYLRLCLSFKHFLLSISIGLSQ